MKIVHIASKEILSKRGAIADTMTKIDEWPGVDRPAHVTAVDDTAALDGDDSGNQADDQDQQAAADASSLHSRHLSTGFPSIFYHEEDLCLSEQRNYHGPFLSCTTARNWCQLGAVPNDVMDAESGWGDVLGRGQCRNIGDDDDDELLFLI